MSEKVLAVIPARYASTRFPGKPLHPIAGRPMIVWTALRARAAATVHDVLIATDDARIRDAAENAGFRAVLTSAQARSGSDRIAEAIAGAPCDVIVNVQGDEPLIHPQTIDAAVCALLADPACQVSTSCVEIRSRAEFESPHNTKVVLDGGGHALYFSRSPIPSLARRPPEQIGDGQLFGYKHQGLYVYRREALMAFTRLPMGQLEDIEKLEQLRYLEHGYRIRVVITEHDSPGVDTPDDVAAVEARLANPS